MANGLPRTEKYKKLNVEEHLYQLDNELDENDYRLEILAKSISSKLNWVLVTFVSLIIMVCGVLVAAVVGR